MTPADEATIAQLNAAVEALLAGKPQPALDAAECDDKDLSRLRDSIERLLRAFSESNEFIAALSMGNLEMDPPARNFLVSRFKQLHANLRHLSWQTQQIAKGDLSQKVTFLGEFSLAFNAMIESLRAKRRVEQALAESEEHLRTITSVLGEGVFVLDIDGKLTFINPEAERILGWNTNELIGRNFHDLVHYQQADGSRMPFSECPVHNTLISARSVRIDDDVFTRKDGAMVPVSHVSNPIIKNGAVVATVTAFSDITERKRIQDALERQATTDVLTGIYNRLKFSELLLAEIGRSRRFGTPLSLIMLDIDHFKAINDTHGHHAGDNVLKEVTRLIAANIRKYESFARWGGEEFMLLVPNATLENTLVLAYKLCAMIGSNVFDGGLLVTCSFGVAEFRPEDTLESFTRRADEALYRAKANGRNRVEADTVEA